MSTCVWYTSWGAHGDAQLVQWEGKSASPPKISIGWRAQAPRTALPLESLGDVVGG